jgi:hypothetical protein
MNSIIYVDNDPTKPVIYIGSILFFCQDNKIRFLLLENSSAKFEDIGIGLDTVECQSLSPLWCDNLAITLAKSIKLKVPLSSALDVTEYNNYNSESDNEDNINRNIIDTIIIKALRLHTNYLIDITVEYIEKAYTKQIYIPSEMALIKFISITDDAITNLKSEDFGMYTVKTNEDKIKRYIKWVEKSYFFRTLYRFNKISKKINNKEILDGMRSVESENKLKKVLKSIRNKIVSSAL